MQTPWAIKFLVVFMLLAVIASLALALVQLIRDRGRSTRLVQALSLRIGLSVLLFVLLLVGMFTGVVVPHGVVP